MSDGITIYNARRLYCIFDVISFNLWLYLLPNCAMRIYEEDEHSKNWFLSLSLYHFPKDVGGGMAVSDGSVISYSPQTDRDYGTLLCWARNDIGEQREPCVYRIFLGGPSLYLFPLYCPHPVASQLLVDGQRANGLYKLRVSLRLSSVYLVSVSFFRSSK